jgi:predicted small integral membrane protein
VKHVRRLTALLWGTLFLTTCIQAVWEHGLPEVTPFTSFLYLTTAFALSLAALAGREEI